MKKIIAAVTAIAVTVLVLLSAIAAPTAADPNAAFAAEVLRLTNVERVANGLVPLHGLTHTNLNAAAQLRAVEIVEYWSHTRPDGRSWMSVLPEFGIEWNAVGENLARGQGTPEMAVQDWMASPGHRANILDTRFTHMGVGVYFAQGEYHWVQIFLYDRGRSPADPVGGNTTTTTTTTTASAEPNESTTTTAASTEPGETTTTTTTTAASTEPGETTTTTTAASTEPGETTTTTTAASTKPDETTTTTTAASTEPSESTTTMRRSNPIERPRLIPSLLHIIFETFGFLFMTVDSILHVIFANAAYLMFAGADLVARVI